MKPQVNETRKLYFIQWRRAGSECEFGKQAEKTGVQEVNFTFRGHKISRSRGLRVLTTDELLKGDVSLAYIAKMMNRKFNTGKLFKKVMQSIWHQINCAEEVFVVGKILDDNTVKEEPVGVLSLVSFAINRFISMTRNKNPGLNGMVNPGNLKTT